MDSDLVHSLKSSSSFSVIVEVYGGCDLAIRLSYRAYYKCDPKRPLSIQDTRSRAETLT